MKDTINALCKILNIDPNCSTPEEIAENLPVPNKEREIIAIKYFIEKVNINGYFFPTLENYKICRKEAYQLF
jgi:hypothetical protein